MNTSFQPHSNDQCIRQSYPSGSLLEEYYLRDGQPANGWSRKLFYETGQLQLAECFSHSLLIEQITYSPDGTIAAHKIYSHSKKQLIDRPVPGPVVRHNVVSGCAHMGFYYHHLHAIAAFIGANYVEEELEQAYQSFIAEASDDENFDYCKEYTWRLKGAQGSFSISFEKYEMLYFWHLAADTEERYEAAKRFMDQLER